MMSAVVTDLAKLPGVQVITTWDDTLGPAPFLELPGMEVERVRGNVDGPPTFEQLLNRADAALVIAPEFDGILEHETEFFRQSGLRIANATREAIRLCADKLALASHLRSSGIDTIPTVLFTDMMPWPDCVVKRRDGAGSQEMARLQTEADCFDWRNSHRPDRFVIQPFCAGQPVSVGAVYRNDRLLALFPVVEQRLTDDGQFRYLGGKLPPDGWSAEQEHAVCDLVSMAGRTIPGLHGYVGFDLIWTPERGPVLVEINTRLTTGVIGYRELFREEVARQIHACLTADSEVPPIRFEFDRGRHDGIDFHADGMIGTGVT
ncbi:MAG: ATP-grasp domain-containing protein [Planctomycetaceae bacterium]|nr:ATP-grasp domain-containing protein [Planctomycetaceae bacterium]